jgi:outer membrane protein TolC
MRTDQCLVVASLLVVLTLPAVAQEPPVEDGMPNFTRSEPLGAVIETRPGPGELLDLESCVAEAVTANDRLRAERLRMGELEGKKRQALSTGLPTLDLAGSWSRSRDPSFALNEIFGGSGGGLGMMAPPGADPWFQTWLDDFGSAFGSLVPAPGAIPAQTYWNADLNLNWELNPVKIMGATGAAKLSIEQQNSATASVEQETIEATVVAYYSIIRAAENIQAIRAQLANQRELLDITVMRYELGLATRLDTLQAAVTVANTRPQLQVAQARLRTEGSRLNAVMGRLPEAPLKVANTQPIEMDPLHTETALRLAQLRPELMATQLFVDILGKNRQAQKSELLPYLSMNGAYGYIGRTADTVFEDGHDTWRASVALNVPVFDGLLYRGQVKETDARIRRTEAELTGRRRAVQVEVLEIIANLELARDVLAAVQLNLERAEEVLDESLLMMQMGKVSFVDVLVAESNRADARNNVIVARYEVLTQTASLKRAIGWSPMVPLGDIPGLVAEETR